MNTKRDFLHLFRKILLELNLPANILESSAEKEEEFVKSLTVFLQTLEEVLQLVGADDVEKQYPLNFYGDHIRTICNWSRFNVKEKSDQGVLITSINEIRGLKYDYLFLGGMCDGDFPTKYSPEIFNTGSFRKKEMIHQTEERYHFYQTLCCWNKQLYLSIPAGDSESELVESTFIKDLEKVIAIEKSEPDFSENILCKEDLQIAYAKNPHKANLIREFQEKIMDPALTSALIEMRKSRISEPFSENSYCGTIANDDSLDKFLSSYAEKQFSISQLETYAKCPFKYFSERILRIMAIDEPSEEIEPIELGTILHSILFEFYSMVVKEKILIGKEHTKKFESAKEILFNIAGAKLSELKLSSPLAFFEKEKILGIDGNEENSILYKFLQNEADNETKRAFIPELLEQEFVIVKEVKNSCDEETFDAKKFRLRGKIDRVDMDRENKLFNVIDYKLRGRKPSLNDLKNGISLQLPVYMIAAKEMLKKMN
jgi:ATP-dependent helicase/nuclease subunit B